MTQRRIGTALVAGIMMVAALDAAQAPKPVATAAQRINDAIVAMGGEARLTAIKSLVIESMGHAWALEQDADLIMFLARKESTPEIEVGTTDLVIGKHRNGPTGRLELVFHSEYTRFDNLASPARRERF